MTPDLTLKLIKLRTCVAFLGEKNQKNWWHSSFLSRSGEAFLKPVFPKTHLLTRVNGASAEVPITRGKRTKLIWQPKEYSWKY